ncbi:MAG: monovalent cation/H+ antiporter subunit A [Desulfobulbaceae bacterium]|nr:monovalent cation/H+ antiporter subunit A [Desulfobulbaceae bacterium]
MNLLFIILLPLFGAVLPPLAMRLGRIASAWIAAAVTAAALLLAAVQLAQVFRGTPVAAYWDWLPQAGLSISLRLDGLAAMFLLLILGMGLLIILYAHYYLSAQEPVGRFYGMLLLFMGAMLGIVLSDHLLLLLVFWELTSLSSFLLISFWHHRPEARCGARMALAVTGTGGLAMLAGFLLLAHIVGSYQISVIIAAGDIIRSHPLYAPTLLLILLGAFTKSAQFPFHFWLPHAMAAPTPVSAYLHSATMVKAGVFLLARLYPALSGTDLWFFVVGGTGLATLLFAAYTAMFQHDLKGLLAYSTISHLGLIVLLFGIDTPLAAAAGLFHIINHATFKASLFMAAGIIDHETGTRDMRLINGLGQYMPYTATLAMVAAAAMAGVPLLNGFLSKEMFFAETLHLSALGSFNWLLPAAATLAGIFAVAYSLRFIHDVFFNGELLNLTRYPPHDPPRYMMIPSALLVGVCLLVGIFPAYTVAPVLVLAAGGMLGEPPPAYNLAIWHGFTTPFKMSLVALFGGIALYSQRRKLFAFHRRVMYLPDARAFFWIFIERMIEVTRIGTAFLENGSLQRYTALLIFAGMSAVAVPFLGGDAPLTGPLPLSSIDGPTLVGAVVMMSAALVTVLWHRHRLRALIAFSVVGLGAAMAFVRFSAPDLALTQLSIEVVTIMLLLLALFFLPQQDTAESSSLRRGRDGLLALGLGTGAGLLTWGVLTRPQETISGFFTANSLPGGGGANVVNVILVDFRGFDTLGEITVLACAAIGIFALLDKLCLPSGPDLNGRRLWADERHPLVLAQTTRFLLPLALLVSAYLFLRGHNAPGGGFIAGLVTSIALILQYMASGIAWTGQQWRIQYHLVIAWGVLIAVATGAGSWLFNRPFLTSAFGHFHLPLVGDIELATAMLFDLGVYLTVVGVVMLILATLGKLTGRCAEAMGGF